MREGNECCFGDPPAVFPRRRRSSQSECWNIGATYSHTAARLWTAQPPGPEGIRGRGVIKESIHGALHAHAYAHMRTPTCKFPETKTHLHSRTHTHTDHSGSPPASQTLALCVLYLAGAGEFFKQMPSAVVIQAFLGSLRLLLLLLLLLLWQGRSVCLRGDL